MVTSLLPLLAVLAVLTVSAGCRCFPVDFKKQFFELEAAGTPLTSAVVIGVREPPTRFGKRLFTLFVLKAYTDCSTTDYTVVQAESFVSGATCGVFLERYATYILPLKKDGSLSFLSSCRVNKRRDRLTPDESAFLASRYLCCKGRCNCTGQQTPVFCRRACGPRPCKEAEICKQNPCLKCSEEWFTKAGLPACSV